MEAPVMLANPGSERLTQTLTVLPWTLRVAPAIRMESVILSMPAIITKTATISFPKFPSIALSPRLLFLVPRIPAKLVLPDLP